MSLIEKIKSMFKGNSNNDSWGNADLSTTSTSSDTDTAEANADTSDSNDSGDFDGGDFGD